MISRNALASGFPKSPIFAANRALASGYCTSRWALAHGSGTGSDLRENRTLARCG